MGGSGSAARFRRKFPRRSVMLRLVARQRRRALARRSGPRPVLAARTRRRPLDARARQPQCDGAGLLQSAPVDHDRGAAALRREQRRHHDRGAGAIFDQRLPFSTSATSFPSIARATQPDSSQAIAAASRGERKSASARSHCSAAKPSGLRPSNARPPPARRTAATLRSRPRRGRSPKGQGADQTDYK